MSEVRKMNDKERNKGRATRRGISNIVAVLILIFIVIVSSSIVYVLVTDYAVRLSTNVGVEITNAQITSLPNGQSTLTLSVANTGTVAESINVSVNGIETQTLSGLTAYAYFSSSSGDWSLLPYPYTGTIPSNYFATITGWSPPYSYGTPSYQGNTYLGMVTQPFQSKFSNLNQEGSITSGYIAVGTFNVQQYSLYQFQIETDDGTAIWINGPSTNGQWIDVFGGSAWHSQGATYYSANEPLQPGIYQIAIEWLNQGGPGVSAIEITQIPYMNIYTYYSSSPYDWSLVPYPYTGTPPSNYVNYITNWLPPPYSYGTPSYQGNKYLGMTTQSFPSSVNILNTQGSSTEAYIATSSFTVSQTTTYQFQIETDDGTAIWINGPSTNGQWIDVFGGSAWKGQGATSYSVYETLTAGTYQIAIEWINIIGPGVSAIKITPNPFSLSPSFTSSLTFSVTKTYTLETNLQGGATVEQTFLLPIQFTPGQNVTIVVTASSSLGTATTATTVVVS